MATPGVRKKKLAPGYPGDPNVPPTQPYDAAFPTWPMGTGVPGLPPPREMDARPPMPGPEPLELPIQAQYPFTPPDWRAAAGSGFLGQQADYLPPMPVPPEVAAGIGKIPQVLSGAADAALGAIGLRPQQPPQPKDVSPLATKMFPPQPSWQAAPKRPVNTNSPLSRLMVNSDVGRKALGRPINPEIDKAAAALKAEVARPIATPPPESDPFYWERLRMLDPTYIPMGFDQNQRDRIALEGGLPQGTDALGRPGSKIWFSGGAPKLTDSEAGVAGFDPRDPRHYKPSDPTGLGARMAALPPDKPTPKMFTDAADKAAYMERSKKARAAIDAQWRDPKAINDAGESYRQFMMRRHNESAEAYTEAQERLRHAREFKKAMANPHAYAMAQAMVGGGTGDGGGLDVTNPLIARELGIDPAVVEAEMKRRAGERNRGVEIEDRINHALAEAAQAKQAALDESEIKAIREGYAKADAASAPAEKKAKQPGVPKRRLWVESPKTSPAPVDSGKTDGLQDHRKQPAPQANEVSYGESYLKDESVRFLKMPPREREKRLKQLAELPEQGALYRRLKKADDEDRASFAEKFREQLDMLKPSPGKQRPQGPIDTRR